MDTSPSSIDSSSPTPAPWSLRHARLTRRELFMLGTGSVIASFFIGAGDISVATSMGAKFGFRLWWTYFVLGIAGWALIDMSVRYFLQFGKTPMTIFKEVHPVFSAYMFLAVVVCALFGSFSQWNACAMVITGFVPGLPIEASGALAALLALLFLFMGVYKRLEHFFVAGLIALMVCLFVSAWLAGFDWKEAAWGLVPNSPREDWKPLFMSNAGSMINAWLILIYPYTMIERGWFTRDLQGKVNILHRARLDYAWGILAAGVVALPLMAAAAGVARPLGILPRDYMDLSVLLEPVAGTACTYLFLIGLFLAAWTAGVGWWLCGAYALLDLVNLPIKMDTRPMRICLILFFIPSTLLLVLRINPIKQILIFAAFLAVVTPLIALVMLYRTTRPDMGYFRWTLRSPKGLALIAVDLFAVCLSVYLGWFEIAKLFAPR